MSIDHRLRVELEERVSALEFQIQNVATVLAMVVNVLGGTDMLDASAEQIRAQQAADIDSAP